MPAKPNIKWRKSDAEKLNKEVQRFNVKVNRTKKAHPELADILPDTIKKADKQKMIEELKQLPRSEYKKEINTLDRFTKKGAEKAVTSKTGNTVTRWERKEVALKVAQINRERTKERTANENMEVTSRGEKIGMKRGEMGSERMNGLNPKKFNFDKIKGGKEWEKFKESVYKQASPLERQKIMQTYKDHYLKGLDEYGGYADDIKALVDKLPADVVVNTYYSEQEATIKFIYEGLEGLQDKDVVLDTLRAIWEKALAEYEANC